MYKLRVGNQHIFNFGYKNGLVTYNGEAVDVNIAEKANGDLHVLHKNRTFNVEIVELNSEEKTLVLKVNSKECLVEITDEYDDLLRKLGLDKAMHSHVTELKAPMPGLVLNVGVQEGQQVVKGDNLIILEAMKMENIIKSPTDATIKSIKVNIGDKLEKNQVMITFH